jgi:uncharacterized membrane protein
MKQFFIGVLIISFLTMLYISVSTIHPSVIKKAELLFIISSVCFLVSSASLIVALYRSRTKIKKDANQPS